MGFKRVLKPSMENFGGQGASGRNRAQRRFLGSGESAGQSPGVGGLPDQTGIGVKAWMDARR